MSNEKAVHELKKGLSKFKKDAIKEGWEEDEVDEKIAEVFENFPWYKFLPAQKSSMKQKIFNFCLYSFMLYLTFNVVMEKNAALAKKYNDFLFDNQINYQQQRIIRYLTMPIFRFYDLSKYHEQECIIRNPFVIRDELECDFCDGLDSIQHLDVNSSDVTQAIEQMEPFKVSNVPNYENISIGYRDFQALFKENSLEMDQAICQIDLGGYKKASEFFTLSEEEVKEKNISGSWTNCDTYGTRFYRRLFVRPEFISKDKEVYMMKRIYMLQPNAFVDSPDVEQDGTSVVAQVQGSSVFTMKAPRSCHSNCTEAPFNTTLNKGDVLVFSIAGWKTSLRTTGEDMSILYLSKFSR